MVQSAFGRALACAATSLAELDYIEALTCFCFEPGRVYSFDDITMTSAVLQHEIHGGIRGDVLQKLVKSASENFALEQVNNEVWFRDGRTRIKLNLLPPDLFLWRDETGIVLHRFMAGPQFFEALGWANSNLLADAYQPVYAGITLQIGTDNVKMYAYDFAALLYSVSPIEKVVSHKKRVTIVIPAEFAIRARKIYSILGNDGQVEVVVGTYGIEFLFNGVEIVLGSKIVDESPPDFGKQLAGCPKYADAFEIPTDLNTTLERCLALSNDPDQQVAKLATSPRGISIRCDAAYGNVESSLPMSLPNLWPKIQTFHFLPKILMRKMKVADRISFTNEADKSINLHNSRMRFIVPSIDAREVKAKLTKTA